MYLIERQKKILGLLLSCDGWMTGTKIGGMLGITDRTVRNDIKDINEELKEYPGCYIESARGKGYLLAGRNKEELLKEIEKTNANESIKGRLCNLALEILMGDESIQLDDLEEEFYISRTTLEAAIKNINEKCAHKVEGNVLVHKKNAIFAECTETDRRKLIRLFIFVSEGDAGGAIRDEYGFLNREDTRKLVMYIRKVLAKRGMQLMDQDMTEAVLQLYIQCMRIKMGCLVEEVEIKHQEVIPDTMRKITAELAELLEKDIGIKYSDEEQTLFAAYLCDIRMVKTERFTKKEIESIIEPKYLVIVEELLNDIKNDFMLDLTQDDELFVDLVLHIRFSIKFGKGSPHQDNPLLDTMKNRYPFVFELSTYIFTRFYDALGIELNENQLSYVAAHLGAALERLESTKSSSDFKIAVCSNMNMGVIRLLMAKLYSLYANRISIIGPYPVYDMESMIKDRPSIILTTTSSSLFRRIDIPVITISAMLEPSDVLAINQMIGKLKRDSVVFTLPDGGEQYFEEDLFFPQIELKSQEQVLEFLSEKIIQKGYASEELLVNTLEREKIAPTTFANQIAMPHPMRICAYRTVIAVATLKEPVLWGNLRAQLIFMLAVRGSDMKYMNGFFDIISDLVWDKKKVQKLTAVTDFREFIEELG